MSDFTFGQIPKKFTDGQMPPIRREAAQSNGLKPNQAENFAQNLQKNPAPIGQTSYSQALNSLIAQPRALRNIEMNHLASLERALYVKDLMALPKNLSELLQTIQKQVLRNSTGANGSGLLNLGLDLNQIALLLQQNGKEAVNKLIMTMANASKQGITDLSELKNMIKLINASVATAGENSTQTLKTLMLLYLPWIPLQEGVGFDLEIETSEGASAEDECTLTILISTKNFGNIKATLILDEGISISILINCSEKFPKEELLKRLNAENKTHSIQTNIAFEQSKLNQPDSEESKLQAKVSLSNNSNVNPFLLLTAQALIRITIEIDTEN